MRTRDEIKTLVTRAREVARRLTDGTAISVPTHAPVQIAEDVVFVEVQMMIQIKDLQ
jgi:hypothetical protein